ncbi:MAG: hypothetical protein GY810_26530 [Aureispira sp.]|nr:hypothetical protein [Aureispira sp.]
MMQKWFILLLSIVCFTVTNIQAQNSPKEDVIYLKNGSIIRGQILEYQPEGNIKVEIQGGSILVYKTSEVIKVVKEPMKNPPSHQYYIREKKPPILKTKGMYHYLGGGILFGVSDWGGPSIGLSLFYAGGYQINNYIAVGGGIEFITLFNQYNFVPIFADIRGYLLKKPTSIYYSLGIGYNLALKSQSWQWNITTKAEGGIYARPAIGIRAGSRKRTNFMIDFGFNIMSANYHYEDWNGNPVIEKRIFYRPNIRCGVLF